MPVERPLSVRSILAAGTLPLLLPLVCSCSAAPNPRPAPGAELRESTAPVSDPESLVASPEEAAGEQTAEPVPAATRQLAQPGSDRTEEGAGDPEQGVPVERTAYGSIDSGVPIAVVAGETIDVSELVAHWLHHKSNEVEDVLDQLALSRLVLAEAQRLGARLHPEEVVAGVDEALEALGAEVERQAPGMTTDEFIRSRLGLNPERYRKRLRYFAIIRELTPLVIRAWLLDGEHATARMIALEDPEQVTEVRRALDEGLSFEEAARRFSAEPGEAERGRLMTIARDDSPMARMVFATAPGTVGGPFEQPGALILVWVEERPDVIQGSWAVVGERVRESLREDPFERLEYLQWTEAMRRRYTVDYSPFLELVGEVDPRRKEPEGDRPRD